MEKEREMISYSQNKFLKVFIVDLSYCAPQLHSDFEIDLILDGAMTIKTPDGTEVFRQGDMCIFSPDKLHELVSAEGNSRLLCIQFPSVPNDEAYVALFRGLQFKSSSVRNSFAQNPGKYELLYALCLRLSLMYFENKSGSSHLCTSLLSLIMHFLVSNLPTERTVIDDNFSVEPRNDRITRILSNIERNYHQKLLLSDIAEAENLSLSYLSHFFKSTMHMTFQEYLNKQRFEHACAMLLSTNKTILEISELCGFSDMRYLTDMCRKIYNCTPQKYREANKPPRYMSKNLAQYFLSDDECAEVLKTALAQYKSRLSETSVLELYE